MAIDDTSVYWAEYFEGAIMRIDKSGGAPVTLASGQSPEEAIALDDSYVYWVDSGGALKRVPLAGGTPDVLATAADFGFTQQMAVNASHVYWVFYRYTGTSADGALLRAPIEGGPVETLATVAGRAYGVTLDDTAVYWSNSELDAIMRTPLSGGSSAELVTTSTLVNASVQVDGTSIYFNDVFSGQIKKGPLTGGAAQALADGSTPITLALDDTRVYWAEMVDDGSVRATSKSGGAVVTVATNQARPRALAVDDTAVYWTTLGAMGSSGESTLMKAAK